MKSEECIPLSQEKVSNVLITILVAMMANGFTDEAN